MIFILNGISTCYTAYVFSVWSNNSCIFAIQYAQLDLRDAFVTCIKEFIHVKGTTAFYAEVKMQLLSFDTFSSALHGLHPFILYIPCFILAFYTY